eukprot:gene2720-3017_t
MIPKSLLVFFIVAAAVQAAQARMLLQHVEEPTVNRANARAETQAGAWTSAAGNEPGGPGDAFTWKDAEASSASQFNGIFYNAATKVVESGDRAKGGWAGTYITHNTDLPTINPVAGPVPQKNIMTPGVDGYNTQRSVAYTDVPPTSVAQSGTGNGPVAYSVGYQVSSAARAYKDKKVPVTVGHREVGDALQSKLNFDPAVSATQGKKTRKQLLSVLQDGLEQLSSQLTGPARSPSHRRSLMLRGRPLLAAQ